MSSLSPATSIFLDHFGLDPGRPDRALLEATAIRFANLPWENLTKFIRKHQTGADGGSEAPALDRLRRSEEVLSDHVRLGTGGTCFSLTNALRRIALDLGFQAHPVMADMQHAPNTHCALVVMLGKDRFLLDPGYLLAEPVSLDPARTARVSVPGQELCYRPRPGGDRIELHTINERGEERFRYRLHSTLPSKSEFIRHWLASFHWTGMNGLHLNRIAEEGRLSAHNWNLRIDGGTEKTNLKLRGDYVGTVSKRFGIDPRLVRIAFEEWERERCRPR